MTEERQIDYDLLLHDAFREAQRGVMRTVLSRVAEKGLPGEHHFYISFHTHAAGVEIAPRLVQKYPSEMTIVLQHRFWDLFVHADYFEVKLTFDSIRERLVIPFSAVRMFFDPSVPYGLQFEEPGPDGRASDVVGFGARSDGRGSKAAGERRRTGRKQKADVVDDGLDPLSPLEDVSPKEGGAKAGSAASKAGGDGQPSTPIPVQGPKPKSGPRLVEPAIPAEGAKVVSLDQFRKK